jgi:hypothetical protein
MSGRCALFLFKKDRFGLKKCFRIISVVKGSELSDHKLTNDMADIIKPGKNIKISEKLTKHGYFH